MTADSPELIASVVAQPHAAGMILKTNLLTGRSQFGRSLSSFSARMRAILK
jgi:hypothetical protein